MDTFKEYFDLDFVDSKLNEDVNINQEAFEKISTSDYLQALDKSNNYDLDYNFPEIFRDYAYDDFTLKPSESFPCVAAHLNTPDFDYPGKDKDTKAKENKNGLDQEDLYLYKYIADNWDDLSIEYESELETCAEEEAESLDTYWSHYRS